MRTRAYELYGARGRKMAMQKKTGFTQEMNRPESANEKPFQQDRCDNIGILGRHRWPSRWRHFALQCSVTTMLGDKLVTNTR